MIYMFAEKSIFDVLCTCKATSLSKMAKLVRGYSDDATDIIENVLLLKSSAWRKRSLERNCH